MAAQLSKAARLALREAQGQAYATQSMAPLSAWQAAWSPTLPAWVQKSNQRVAANIPLLVTREQSEANRPLAPFYVPDGTLWAQGLAEVQSQGSGVYRSVKVYTVLNMTYGDYIAEAEQNTEDFKRMQPCDAQGYAALVIPIWRVFPY